MVFNSIEYILMLSLVQLVVLILNGKNTFGLLILSELCWWSLYAVYAIAGSYFSNMVLFSMPLFVLVLSAVDCTIWIMFIAYFNLSNINLQGADIRSDARFMFRASRMMSANRFIK